MRIFSRCKDAPKRKKRKKRVYKSVKTSVLFGSQYHLTVKDLLDDHVGKYEEHRKMFYDFEELYGDMIKKFYPNNTRKMKAEFMARKIISMFLEEVINDVVENDVYASLLYDPAMGLMVKGRSNTFAKNYKYNPKTGGREFKLYLHISRRIYRQTQFKGCVSTSTLKTVKTKIKTMIDEGYLWG